MNLHQQNSSEDLADTAKRFSLPPRRLTQLALIAAAVLSACTGGESDTGAVDAGEGAEPFLETYATLPITDGANYALYGQGLKEEVREYVNLYGPTGFAVDADGNIWMGNGGAVYGPVEFPQNIYKFDSEGKWQAAFAYPEGANIGDFYTSKNQLLALNTGYYSDDETGMLTLSEEGKVEDELNFPDGYNAFENGYTKIKPVETGAALVKEAGQSFATIHSDGTLTPTDSLDQNGHDYQISGGELLIDGESILTLPDGVLGTMVFVGFTQEEPGICVAEELVNEEGGFVSVTSTIHCFDENGSERASVEIPLGTAVSCDVLYAMGEGKDSVYTLEVQEDQVVVHKISLF